MSEPLEMNPEIRARWTAKLRSGEVKQATGRLRGEGNERCCLGVLCDLAVAAGVIQAPAQTDSGWYYAGRRGYLPQSVAAWAGLADSNPNIRDDAGDRQVPLGFANDHLWDFAQIADAIDGTEPEVTP